MLKTDLTTQIALPSSVYLITDNDFVIDGERKYVLRVKDLETEDKPREKLKAHGPKTLNVAELMAIVLTAGTRKEEVMQMSTRIIKEYGEKGIAYQTDPAVLCRDLGIPEVKACQIVACFELGRRFFEGKAGGRQVIRNAKQAFAYFKDMRDLPKEQLRGIYLNSHYQVIYDEVISIGSLTSNVVHPREVFRPALVCGAVAVILAHNHPSGCAKPSDSDVMITEKLLQAGNVMGINLLDHIIIAGDKFSSIPAKYS